MIYIVICILSSEYLHGNSALQQPWRPGVNNWASALAPDSFTVDVGVMMVMFFLHILQQQRKRRSGVPGLSHTSSSSSSPSNSAESSPEITRFVPDKCMFSCSLNKLVTLCVLTAILVCDTGWSRIFITGLWVHDLYCTASTSALIRSLINFGTRLRLLIPDRVYAGPENCHM